ncbi:MAG: hypothetical protein JOZ18_01560 [Chloroflexi bacterium]|nr:hypothetical protein [Chloroflexota bacterium]
MGFIRLVVALVRPILFFLTSLAWRIIIGTLLIVGGIIYGINSHQVTYRQAPLGQYEILFADDGTYYLHLQGNQTYYIIKLADFTQMPDATALNSDQGFTSLIYQTIPEQASITLNGTHVSVTGYELVQFAVPATYQHPAESFATTEYEQHPQGFYDNRWVGAGILWGVALLFLAFSFLLRRILKKKPQDTASVFQNGASSLQVYTSPLQVSDVSTMDEGTFDWNLAAFPPEEAALDEEQVAFPPEETELDEDSSALSMEEIALRQKSADITTKRMAVHSVPKRPTQRNPSSHKLSRSRLKTY